MGGQSSSTPQSGLSSLFLNNQPTQMGQQNTLPPITAPQSLIAQGLLPAPVLHPVYTPPPPVAAPAPSKPYYFGQSAYDGTGGH